MSNPNPPTSAGEPPPWSLGIGLAALVAFAVFLHHHGTVVVGGADSSGYFNSARLFAEGRMLATLRAPAPLAEAAREHPMQFLPLGFMPGADRTLLTPTYPTGLPLLLAAAGRSLGWEAGARIVFLGAALAAVWLCHRAARLLGLGRALAWAGAVMLGACPVFLFTSVQPLSDTLATTAVLATLVALLRAQGGTPAWAAAGGAACALAVLVRPTNLLLVPAFLVLLGWPGKRWLLFIAGGVPGALWQALYNHHLYGSALRSGYGNIFDAFATAHGWPTAVHFARWLALLLPTAALALPLIALVSPGPGRRNLLALGMAFASVTGCYLFYEVSHEVWWCLRFILPVIPALILAALLGVESLARGPVRHWPHFRAAAALALGVWALAQSAYWSPRLSVFLMRHYEQAYADGIALAKPLLPNKAPVLCLAFSGALYFHTGSPVLRWDQLDQATFHRYATLSADAGLPIRALLFEAEEKEAFQRCPGGWTRVARTGNVGLWHWNAATP